MRGLFFPYLLANYPDRSAFTDVFDLTMAYADAIEIGIPFSDPVADGSVIANASSKVLSQGFSIETVFRLLQEKKSPVPVAIMSYANPILAYGFTEFLKAAAECGKHLIVPDVPFEEAATWRQTAGEYGLNWISFVALSTGEARLKRIAEAAEGFLYLLSLKGITGSTIHSPEQIRSKAMLIRQYTQVPIALGFGIKSVEDTLPYCEVIDAFIVGSRIIEVIQSGGVEALRGFYENFRSTL